MNRGRTIWLGLLLLGLLVGLLLRTPRRAPEGSAPEPRAAPSSPRSGDESGEFEIEVADPSEVGITPRPAAQSPGSNDAFATEAELNQALAAAWATDPARALALSEEGEKRFGESSRAVERRLYEIKALVKLGRIGSARTRAERYLAAYPPGPMTNEVERLTGVHRRPQPEKPQ
jgi:hypothetical protein